MWLFNAEEREARRKAKEEERRARQAASDRWKALLQQAINIGEANLVCHDDLWRFIAGSCSTGVMYSHFIAPDRNRIVRGERGMLTVPVSGRTLAAILDRTGRDAQSIALPSMNQAAAQTVRDAIVNALRSHDGQSDLTVTIDHRP